ncbi:phytanoyl-CoA dioxygenase family protein [Cohnella rhizosphaerae]|uniref:Phytanoyl-CoA dioxygenase family protein n=1 Tax=Cohnella rhizosphaerae TaxID=1457232 RepID=A0A9X4KVW3_9BACL|nr:phytanoyl-CoA dioxygenase family protein [Cohnella rhizosphaerae]MDG0809032.1 phytanoyl-CoA dioxygenase family protein [Cohnella rhizosphaerae]
MRQKLNFLSGTELEDYNRQGYLVLRNVFSEAEAKVLQIECDKLLTLSEYTDPKNIRAGYKSYANGETKIERFDPVHDISPVFASLVQDDRLLAPLRDIYLDEPKLFKDKLIFKLPGANGYSMHQDASWWQGFPIEGLISVMVAIDGATAENGGAGAVLRLPRQTALDAGRAAQHERGGDRRDRSRHRPYRRDEPGRRHHFPLLHAASERTESVGIQPQAAFP